MSRVLHGTRSKQSDCATPGTKGLVKLKLPLLSNGLVSSRVQAVQSVGNIHGAAVNAPNKVAMAGKASAPPICFCEHGIQLETLAGQLRMNIVFMS
jgi:hypothetical protein